MTAILEKLTLYWTYPFVRYALVVGVLIALCSSLLGVTLVLKRFSFIGDGLSHVAFGAMAIAAVLQITNEMPLVIGHYDQQRRSAFAYRAEHENKGRCSNRHDFGGSACHWLSGDEYFLHLIQPFGRCMQYAVWLHLHPDAVTRRSVALRWNVGAGRGGVRPVLQ